MKGHVGLFVLGLGMAAAGAMVYDKVRSGEIDTGEIGDRIKEVSNQVARQIGDVTDQVQDNVIEMRDRVSDITSMSMVDINECSREDLRDIGIPEDVMERVIEGRPYRNKMDLLTRMVVPQDIYDRVKSMLEVHGADEDVKVA
jgi:hypothetical protein